MITTEQVNVFEGASMIREAIVMLCYDRLPRLSSAEPAAAIEERTNAIDRFCWELFTLQGKRFPLDVLTQKCATILSRTSHLPLRQIRPEDVAREISSPVGGW